MDSNSNTNFQFHLLDSSSQRLCMNMKQGIDTFNSIYWIHYFVFTSWSRILLATTFQFHLLDSVSAEKHKIEFCSEKCLSIPFIGFTESLNRHLYWKPTTHFQFHLLDSGSRSKRGYRLYRHAQTFNSIYWILRRLAFTVRHLLRDKLSIPFIGFSNTNTGNSKWSWILLSIPFIGFRYADQCSWWL